MRKAIILLLIGGGMIAASYKVGEHNGLLEGAEASRAALAEEIKRQGVTDEKISKMGDAAMCRVIGGRLSDSGECE